MHSASSPTPHDAVFRKLLSHVDTARDFFHLHLPEPLREQCDLSTLVLESGSFIEDDLRLCYSDILYSLKTTSGEGYLYALVEHQSSPERHMAFRLMRYAIAAMQRHLDKGHRTLPLVIPMLFYHGKISPWPWSLRWFDGFHKPELAQQLYSEAFPLVDITCVPDDEILQHRRVAMLELLQKHIRQRDLLTLHAQLVRILTLGYTSPSELKTLLNYLVQAGHTADPAAFLSSLASSTRDHQQKETLMNIAQYLREEGMAQGLNQGLAEGIEKGIEQEALRIARTMLENGIEPTRVSELTGLAPDIVEQAQH